MTDTGTKLFGSPCLSDTIRKALGLNGDRGGVAITICWAEKGGRGTPRKEDKEGTCVVVQGVQRHDGTLVPLEGSILMADLYGEAGDRRLSSLINNMLDGHIKAQDKVRNLVSEIEALLDGLPDKECAEVLQRLDVKVQTRLLSRTL